MMKTMLLMMTNIWLAQTGAQPQMPGQNDAPPLQPLPHPELPEVHLLPEPQPVWIYVVGGLVVVALLALVLWLLLRPRAPAALPPRRPWAEAMAALQALSAKSRSLPPPELAGQVSEILRRYFLQRYGIPAPFRTSGEIFDESASVKAPRIHKYAPLAVLWDELSFAPQPESDSEAGELLARAMTHLEEDRPV